MNYKIIFLLLILPQFIYCQHELINTYSTWHEIAGGTEDGGIDRTETYLFVAGKKINIKGIFYNGSELKLNAGDSLSVSCYSFKPYGNGPVETLTNVNIQSDPKKRFQVTKSSNSYFAREVHPYIWNKTIEYTYKKKTFCSTVKSKFDKGEQVAAP